MTLSIDKGRKDLLCFGPSSSFYASLSIILSSGVLNFLSFIEIYTCFQAVFFLVGEVILFIPFVFSFFFSQFHQLTRNSQIILTTLVGIKYPTRADMP